MPYTLGSLYIYIMKGEHLQVTNDRILHIIITYDEETFIIHGRIPQSLDIYIVLDD